VERCRKDSKAGSIAPAHGHNGHDHEFVRRYGLRLLPELYECFNPMPYQGARDMEVELAIGLRDEGYGVWQG
jgi:hypothetical protein